MDTNGDGVAEMVAIGIKCILEKNGCISAWEYLISCGLTKEINSVDGEGRMPRCSCNGEPVVVCTNVSYSFLL
ncbi:hypothetical protein [Glaciimonas sp. PCH181]|uniref:hypothetical protein n=1 Tax=Glaciimonas sp. PCH181 TaxID=2133943 RepID=UPI000D3B0490|nr:hypothetical protein [Glaciimonas sp. PCH181]PUA19122.1 hypothetical protein C7W93_04285 [Glaciimonas sp. PCH181]